MAGQCKHGPVQTSAVVVLRPSQCPAVPPPSPPTPSLSTSDIPTCDPIEPLSLDQAQDEQSWEQRQAKEQRLRDGLHVLNTEALALRNLTKLYETDAVAREGFNHSVQAIIRQENAGGKLVIIGVGKSGYIGQKLVATFKSLAIHAVFLHPTEALHGDMGIVGPNDTLMFISFSGKTQELFLMLPHLDMSLPVILLTAHTSQETCDFFNHRPDTILLPAPILEPENVSFGVSAPTTSTTMALAIGDALAIASAKELHANVSSVFERNHPGGAIGAAAKKPTTVKDLSLAWADILPTPGLNDDSLGGDLLRAGYDSKTGWVRVEHRLASPSRIRSLSTVDLTRKVEDIHGLLIAKPQMLSLSASTSIQQAQVFLQNVQSSPAEDIICDRNSVLAIMEKGEIVGVLEAGKVLDHES